MEHKLGHYPPADFPVVLRGLAAVSRLLAVLEGIGIGASLLALVGLSTFAFVSRNMHAHHQAWFPEAPHWLDGVVRHSVFLIGFLGASYATFTGRHIRIDAITRLASPRQRLVLRMVTTAVALTVLWFLLRASFDFYKIVVEESGEATSQGEVFNSARGTMILLGGYGLIGFHFIVQLLLDAVWVVRRVDPPASWIAEAHGDEPAATGQDLVEPDPEQAIAEVGR